MSGRLTRAEGEELARLRAYTPVGSWTRFCELSERCLIYGSEGAEPQPFPGLKTFYRGETK